MEIRGQGKTQPSQKKKKRPAGKVAGERTSCKARARPGRGRYRYGMPRKRVVSQRLMVIGPRLSQASEAIAIVGRSIDSYGLASAVVAMLATQALREAETQDQGRMMALAEAARLWTGVAERYSTLQGVNAKPIKEIASPPSGSPMPFKLDAFERRRDPEDKA